MNHNKWSEHHFIAFKSRSISISCCDWWSTPKTRLKPGNTVDCRSSIHLSFCYFIPNWRRSYTCFSDSRVIRRFKQVTRQYFVTVFLIQSIFKDTSTIDNCFCDLDCKLHYWHSLSSNSKCYRKLSLFYIRWFEFTCFYFCIFSPSWNQKQNLCWYQRVI